MRSVRTAGWLLLGGLLAACAGQPPELVQPTPRSYELSLVPGRAVAIPAESMSVTLSAVSDSRCPTGVSCIWMGHAAVTLQVRQDGVVTPVVIGTPAPEAMALPSAAMLGPYRFSLTRLLPWPARTQPVPLAQYRAQVQMVRLAR